MRDLLGFLNAIIPNQEATTTSRYWTKPIICGRVPEMYTLHQYKGKAAKYLYHLLPGELG